MKRGAFIILEGIDGSGTTTQTRRLETALAARGVPVHTTQEPTHGPIGSLIRQVLRGRLVTGREAGGRELSWKIMTLLFAADRIDHLESEIEPALENGTTVVSDRYVYSSLAYQEATSGEAGSGEWIAQANRHAARGDLVLFLDTSPRTAAARMAARRGGVEIYEDLATQERVAARYRKVLGELMAGGGDVVFVDGDLDADAVHERCLAEALRVIGE